MAARPVEVREQGGPGDRHAVLAADLGHVPGRELAADRDLHQAALHVAHHRDQRVHLLDGGLAARHRLAGIAVVADRHRGAEADRAGFHRLAHQLLHRADLVLRGGALGQFLAHDVEPQRRVAEQGGDVDRRAALLERVEILREGLERPGVAQAGLERLEAHALDLLERLHDQLAMDRLGRGDAEAAIADHRRGHAMPRRDAEHAIPQDLRVVVRVHIDEARRHDLAGGVDGRGGRPVGLAQGDDLAVLDADVADEARLARAVDDRAARDLQIEGHDVCSHECPFILSIRPLVGQCRSRGCGIPVWQTIHLYPEERSERASRRVATGAVAALSGPLPTTRRCARSAAGEESVKVKMGGSYRGTVEDWT